mgnify:CR=1 FL=1
MYITILNNMNVLSLFDGMSCGQIALKESGINVDKYFASEIDKYAISQTQTNFPDTIQLGDVTKVSARDLPVIDLLIGGSPCQGFSFAGKQLNFDDPRSVLFFEYVRILKEIREKNPNVKFLLENVRMKKECERVISEILGVQPVVINSALVSAQNRVRLYWSNIRTRKEGLFGELYTDIPQPEDRNIFLKDILEPSVDEKYFLSDKVVSKLLEHKERHKKTGNGFGAVFHNESGKMGALTVGGKGVSDLVCVAMRGREVIRKDYESGEMTGKRKNIQQLEPRNDGKTNSIATVHKDNLILAGPGILQRPRGQNKGGLFIEKSPTISTSSWEQNNLLARVKKDESKQDFVNVGERVRRLTPTECARLQTIPDWYVWKCSETQIYRMLGNGWTVEVIKHIFSFLI